MQGSLVRTFLAAVVFVNLAAIGHAGHKDKACYAPTACSKCDCDGYQLRCIRQTEFIETACCPRPLPKYIHCCPTCPTCHHEPLEGPCQFRYWLTDFPFGH